MESPAEAVPVQRATASSPKGLAAEGIGGFKTLLRSVSCRGVFRGTASKAPKPQNVALVLDEAIPCSLQERLLQHAEAQQEALRAERALNSLFTRA